MSIAEGNGFNIGIYPEGEDNFTFGMTQADYTKAALLTAMGGAQDFYPLAVMSESISYSPTNIDIQQGGQTQFSKSIGGPSSGDVTCYLEFPTSSRGHYYALEGGMRNTHLVLDSDVAGCNVALDGTEMVITGTGLPTTPRIGGTCKITTPEAANSGIFVVNAVSATEWRLENANATSETGVSVNFTVRSIWNANKKLSYVLEKAFTDISEYQIFPGQVCTGFSLQINSRSFIQVGFNFTGNAPVDGSSTTVSNSAYSSAVLVQPFDSATNVTALEENGSVVAGWVVQSINANVTHQGSGDRDGVGIRGVAGVRRGTFTCEIQVSGLLADSSYFNKLISGAATSLRFRTQDDAGNIIIWTWPRVIVSDQSSSYGDANSDIQESITFKSTVGAGGYMMIADHYPAA